MGYPCGISKTVSLNGQSNFDSLDMNMVTSSALALVTGQINAFDLRFIFDQSKKKLAKFDISSYNTRTFLYCGINRTVSSTRNVLCEN